MKRVFVTLTALLLASPATLHADGTLKKGLFTPDNIRLTEDSGCALYTSKLKPLVERLLAKP